MKNVNRHTARSLPGVNVMIPEIFSSKMIGKINAEF
jgi:hypothetical protein